MMTIARLNRRGGNQGVPKASAWTRFMRVGSFLLLRERHDVHPRSVVSIWSTASASGLGR